MMIFVALFWLVIVGAIIFVLWLVYRIAHGKGWIDGRAGRGAPEQILKERYARGEIDRETYQRMLDDLGRGPSA